MRAEQFIKDHGVEKAREVVSGASELWFAYDAHDQVYMRCGDIQDGYSIADYEDCFLLDDLKRLVESVDIVNKLNGIKEIKRIYETRPFDLAYSDLKQAIADYESIYGEGNE